MNVKQTIEIFIEMCVVLSKAQADLEEELKKESISDISSRAILMLDKLQSILYHKQIQKIEEFFREEINLLMDAIVQYMIERRWANDEKAERKKYLFKLAQQSKNKQKYLIKLAVLAIILDRCILAKCVLFILENKCNTCWNEYVSLAEAAIFEHAFRLGARLIIEVQKDSKD